jgi:hypothetical protein
MKNLANHPIWSNTPRPSKTPAPEIPSKNPTPPNASNIDGGFFAII